jgi:hypothetical protein
VVCTALIVSLTMPARAAERTSSVYYTKWKAGLAQLLTTANPHLAQRAVEDVREAGAGMPEAERQDALRFLRVIVRQGVTHQPGPFLNLFAADRDDRRRQVFEALDGIAWSGGTAGLTRDLLEEMAAHPDRYSSESLLLPAFVATCRAQRVPAATVAALATGVGASPEGRMDVLCLGNRLHPGEAARWRALLDEQIGTDTDGARLAQRFTRLDHAAWNDIERVREAYRRAIADRLHLGVPPETWPRIQQALFQRMVSASAHEPEAWMTKLAETLIKTPAADVRQRLAALVAWRDRPEAAYRALAPALRYQAVFCFLHEPVGQSVMDLLHKSAACRTASRRILTAFLDVRREAAWDDRLGAILERYYAQAIGNKEQDAANAIFTDIVKPILTASMDEGFDRTRAERPIRRNLMTALMVRNCFLQPTHQREALLWFQDGLDWEADIALTGRVAPNYRFTAEALLAVGQRRAGANAPRAEAVAHIGDLARWLDWMLRGGIQRPDTLHLGVDTVDETIRSVCAAWRDLKNRYSLRRAELGLGDLFTGLMDELGKAVTEIRAGGGADDAAARQRRDRVVRVVRLTLTISALLEEDGYLSDVLAIIRDRLFELPAGEIALRIRAIETLRMEVDLFRILDDDLAECLRSLHTARDTGEAMRRILESFADRYHRDIQLALVATDRFLAELHARDPRLRPYRRYLDGGERHPCLLNDERARASLAMLNTTLDRCGYLNGEAALTELLRVYRARLNLSFWTDPWQCGKNANVGLPVLFRLLRDEPLPALPAVAGAPAAAAAAGAWPAPRFLPVVDALLDAFGDSPEQARLLTRAVAYNAAGAATRTDLHERRAFLWRADLLLRAQELLSFPILTAEGRALDAAAEIESLARSAVSETPGAVLPGIAVPGQGEARRRLDGSRRARLSAAALENAATPRDAVTAAQCALMLPNAESNAAPGQPMADYDRLRATAFERVKTLLAADRRSEALTDGLVVMLRLEAARRGRGAPTGAATLAAQWSANLPPSGQQRVLLETMKLQHYTRTPIEPGRCPRHGDNLTADCRQCRDAVAANLTLFSAQLDAMRRFSLEQAGVKIPDATPDAVFDEWEVLGQLLDALDKIEKPGKLIETIDADTVRVAWYLVAQLRSVRDSIPAVWGDGWSGEIAADEPLADTLVRIARFAAVAYGEMLPIFGDIAMDDLLGDGTRPANGDALSVLSVLGVEVKQLLLEAATVERTLREAGVKLTTPIGALEPRELATVHSALQPLLVTEVWRRGAHRVRDGGSLMQFVVEGRRYDDTYFDADAVYEVGSSFTLTPRRLFDEAFRSIDLLIAAADTADGDAFIYNAWFGDMRQTLAGQGMRAREPFNMDRFIVSAAAIADDPRYDTPEMAEVRGFAETFRRDLNAWMDGDGVAAMSGLMRCARHPSVFTALAERMADRLGLLAWTDSPETLEALQQGRRREAYAGFCRRTLFDTSGGRAVFPEAGRAALRDRFRAEVCPTNAISQLRGRFVDLFTPFGEADADLPVRGSFEGLPGLYRRANRAAADTPGHAFIGDFAFAYMHLASEIYWQDAMDDDNTPPREERPPTLAHPWRRYRDGRPYIDEPLPSGPLMDPNDVLHPDSIRGNFEWRVANAERFRDVPFLCRFFGGDPNLPAGKSTENIQQPTRNVQ